jgi:phosphatidylethanolamine/phosphatidyl-N-methylethanolamine N-methyltransferase
VLAVVRSPTFPLLFLREWWQAPRRVGAVLPSSQALARALCSQVTELRQHRPAGSGLNLLELGAGTGAITQALGSRLEPQDRLDICECNDAFVASLCGTLLREPPFAAGIEEGRIRLLHMRAEEVHPDDATYDGIVCSLPLTALQSHEVRTIIAQVRRLLAPDGVFSYYEYWWIRPVWQRLAWGAQKHRLRRLAAFLRKHVEPAEFARQRIVWNLPPAWVRHLRFDD